MRITRRTLLVGAGTSVVGVLLASCAPKPVPSPRPTGSPTRLPPGGDFVPSAFARSAWSKDPFALGATSFTPVGVPQTVRDALAMPVGDRLFFAGEATDSKAPGTLAGAVGSGVRAAEELLRRSRSGERIAVVGAGLAGAFAAATLVAAGREPTVFEARERLGGRVHAVVDGARWPFPVQLGGWLLEGRDADLRAQIRARDIRAAALASSLWRSIDAEGAATNVNPPAEKAVMAAVVSAQQTLPADVPLSKALTDAGIDPEEPTLAALLAYLTATTGVDIDDASAWFPPTLPARERTAPLGDLTALFETLLDGARVSVSSPVGRVAYDGGGVSIGLASGESLSFDRVMICVPLGVLQSDGIEFAPALPRAHRGAIAELETGSIETVWLRFDERLIDTEATVWHVVGGDAEIRTWFNFAPVTGDNVLMGIVGGAAAAALADRDDDAVLKSARDSLRHFVDAT